MKPFCKSREVHVWCKHVIEASGKSLSFLERGGRIRTLKLRFINGKKKFILDEELHTN
jgi:hypothetical protein